MSFRVSMRISMKIWVQMARKIVGTWVHYLPLVTSKIYGYNKNECMEHVLKDITPEQLLVIIYYLPKFN